MGPDDLGASTSSRPESRLFPRKRPAYHGSNRTLFRISPPGVVSPHHLNHSHHGIKHWPSLQRTPQSRVAIVSTLRSIAIFPARIIRSTTFGASVFRWPDLFPPQSS